MCDVFTMKDAQAAAELLREHNVPPDADGYYRYSITPAVFERARAYLEWRRVRAIPRQWSAVDALRRFKRIR
jgi:hypothetical protein